MGCLASEMESAALFRAAVIVSERGMLCGYGKSGKKETRTGNPAGA